MKKNYFIILFSVINAVSFAQWQKVPIPTTSKILKVCFLDSMTGFLSGNSVGLKTINGGENWSEQVSGSYWLRRFPFPTMDISPEQLMVVLHGKLRIPERVQTLREVYGRLISPGYTLLDTMVSSLRQIMEE